MIPFLPSSNFIYCEVTLQEGCSFVEHVKK